MKTTIKVVNVIDDYKLVLNIGSDDGATEGQKYLIYEVSNEEIFDPATKESLNLLKGLG